MAEVIPNYDTSDSVKTQNNNGFHSLDVNLTKDSTDKLSENKTGVQFIEDVSDKCKMTNNNNIDDGLKPLPGTVKDFYYGTRIFITGATGFLGKVLVEKLLRSCDDIKCIYILMREKRGLSVKQRYKDFVNNIVFDKIRGKWPERLEKIIAIEGDVGEADLGMSVGDRKMLEEEVDIVFHSAATVKFIEPLTEALLLNTMAIKKVIELCHRMKHLKSVVHVSTAFSNVDKNSYIEEKFYPVTYDPDSLLQCISSLPQDLFDILAPKIQGNHPNTYTLTKALGEAIISKYAGGLPLCVIRPSIVTAAQCEPYPGWIDNLFGVTGILMEIYRGTIRSSVCNKEGIIDIFPVDMAVNACISVAWHRTKFSSPTPLIYNCTSGGANSFTWHLLTEYVVEQAREVPSKYVMMYPNFEYTMNRFKNLFWEISTHYLPSIFFDILLRAQGKKPIMVKLTKRFKLAMMAGEYFALHEFKFGTGNMEKLISDLEKTNEHVEFNCDVRKIDWHAYMHWYVLGIRKYILKDNMDSLPMAKKKLQRLFWIQQFIKIVSAYYAFSFLFHRR